MLSIQNLFQFVLIQLTQVLCISSKNSYLYNLQDNGFLAFHPQNNGTSHHAITHQFPITKLTLTVKFDANNEEVYQIRINIGNDIGYLTFDPQTLRMTYKPEDPASLQLFIIRETPDSQDEYGRMTPKHEQEYFIKTQSGNNCLVAGVNEPYFAECANKSDQKWFIFDEHVLSKEFENIKAGKIA